MNQEITCPYCGQQNNIRNVENYLGKKIRIPCGNKQCARKFEHHFEIIDEENVTEVTRKKEYGKEAVLILLENTFHTTTTFHLKEGVEEFGRKSGTNNRQIVTEDTSISRNHFKVTGVRQKRTGNMKFILEDLGSTNKISLNGIIINNSIKPILTNNDLIKVGKSEMIFQYIE